MNPEQQRIAIAEACGWKTETYHHKGGIPASTHWVSPSGKIKNDIPNYPHDLNAMHEAEKALKWEQRKQYHDLLADITGFSYCEADTQEEAYLDWNCRICHATAAQRAEALLKTLNLWTEEDA